MIRFWQELKRRNVFNAAIAYLVVAWLILQVLSIVLPNIEAPDWVLQASMVIMAIGLPIWLFFSWVYEVTPEGIKKSSEVKIDQTITAKTNKRLNILILAALVAVILVILFKPSTELFKTDDGKYAIAVLYFDNMSADEENDWISDGMTEAISTKLERNKKMLVTGRTSVKQFRDSNESIPEITKKLGVSYVLEGSVVVHNNKARITAQLIDKYNTHVWANEYDVELINILDIQNEISKRIVEELKIALSSGDKEALEHQVTDNLEAYKLYQKGRAFADDRSKNGFEKSIEYYHRAIELDSLFSEAYAEIAMTYYLMGGYGIIKREEGYSKASRNIVNALKINPNTVTAYTVKANILTDKQNYDEAKECYEKALDLNPNDAATHHFFGGHYYNRIGDKVNFLKHANIALQLDPLSYPVNLNIIWALLQNDKLDQAEEHLDRNLFIYSKNSIRLFKDELYHLRVKILSVEKKDWTEAIRIYKDTLSKQPENPKLLRDLAVAYDEILNDNENYLSYTRAAYLLDSTNYSNIDNYHNALLENSEFDKALQLMNSENYIKVFRGTRKSFNEWSYFYCKGDYERAFEIIDTLNISYPIYKLLTYAQLGMTNEIKSTFEGGIERDIDKVFVYAILEERDSMYHYLNKDDIEYKFINSRFEFDPYRKEERYKAFLKKNYLPITHWNE